MGPQKETDDRIKESLRIGVDIASGVLNGAVSFLAPGPWEAAALGATVTLARELLRKLADDISTRILGPREKARLAGALAVAAAAIDARTKQGESIRADGFFEKRPGERSDAEELIESVLLKAQREPQEKKIPYMGYLLANIAFDSGVSPAMAHQLVKVAEQLTYRQLCLLKLSAIKSSIPLRNADYRNQGSFSRELYPVLYECLDLYNRGLVHFGGEVAFGPSDVIPAQMTPQGLGVDLYNLMSLDRIQETDLLPIVEVLKQ